LNNYRPVAQSSIACILFEKLLRNHLNNFLISNDIGDKSQHGFTKGLSAETQLVHMLHDWSLMLNRNQHITCVYFDFSKAFDRVNHKLLLIKLANLGIHTKTLNWISSYLTGRSFRVKMNDVLSDLAPCRSGVPQGSCLGPLLFRLFIMDLMCAIPNGVIHRLFADDLKIYNSAENWSDMSLLQTAVNNIGDWCAQNDMIISIPKCAVLISDDRHCDLFLNATPIPCVNIYKDLGVLITPNLDFSAHIDHVVKKASRISSLIFRTFIIKRQEFYLHLYRSLVQPIFLYCCTIWTPYKQKYIESLEAVRRRFIKRLSRRCSLPPSSISLKTVMELHKEADKNMFYRLDSLGLARNLFDIDANNLRSTLTIRAPQIARTEKINNLFTFRLPRVIR